MVGGIIVCAGLMKKVITTDGDAWDLASVLLYMFGMLSSYIFSTLYHACSPDSKWRTTLRKLDHSAIYWHIAGSYSPITIIAMRDTGYWGWGIFIFCWLCAIVGTSLSLYSLKKHNILETVCYVLMGLTILVATKQFYDAVALPVFLWVVGEGVAYITGAVFYSFHKVKYIHTVFHFFVLLGTACHMVAMWYVINGM
jgi:hemolysin III